MSELSEQGIRKIVLAANAGADQPWVADATAQLAKQTGADVAVLAGPALAKIMAFADDEDADLIVLGSSTRGRLAARLLGSVPLSLVQQSKRPVLVVTEPAKEA